jgi:TolB-like protein
MTESARAIFLSYASQDIEPARRICDALRAAGIEVWFDQSELRGGDAWDAAIRKQVRDCALFMALISANTNARSEGYFRREWNLAVQRMLDMADDQPFLLPVLIDDTPEPAARVPDRFRERQWTRLPGGAMVAGFVERVARLLAGQPAPPAATPVAAQPSAPAAGAVRADDGFWIAVLPLKCRGAEADVVTLAEGLTEEIITGLSRFSYLRVIARSSTMRITGETHDARAAGKELGARYVIEGSLRQAGSRLRLAVQVVDAVSGAHLWAENFERSFSKEAAFDLQDDLAARIVSSVADMYGVLPHSMSEAVRRKDPDTLSPYEALLRSFGYRERMTIEEHAANRVTLERAVQQAPGHADALAMLSLLYTDEHSLGFNPLPDPLGRALEAARRAVDAGPSNHRAHFALAVTLFHRKEFQAFRNAAERTLALNPLDGSAAEYLGLCTAYAGDWDRGCALSERAMQLNPSHPGKLWYPLAINKYRQGDYLGALEVALRINTPHIHYLPLLVAAANGQLGNLDAAGKALRDLITLRPDYSAVARDDLSKWFAPELVEQLIDGLRKAGLEVAAADGASAVLPESSKSPAPTPVTARGDEGFWVAVLPFKYRGTDNALTALADGFAEDIVTGLSRFSYLRVISRSSTLRFTDAAFDVRAAGKELGARYVMEGSLRQAGTQLRVAVQLVDATTGAHLWAETYERHFSPESAFVIQDELAPRIVATIADIHGVLPRSMGETVRNRDPALLSPYEGVVRSFAYSQRVTADELAASLHGVELAVARSPAYADAWAMLAWLCLQDYAQGFNLRADSLARGLAAARRAVDAAPSNHLGHAVLAQAFFFHKEFQSFRLAAERAVTLNPMDGYSMAFIGELLTYTGDWERGLELAGRAKQLNPHHPGWYWYADAYHAHSLSDFRGAIACLLRANMPGHWGFHAMLAAAHGQLGEWDAAGKALHELLRLRPDFASIVRREFAKWWTPEYAEHFLDGLRKAGLEIAPAGSLRL